MAIRTALTLTEDQISRMTRFIRSNVEALESQRNNGWLSDRERFEREFDSDERDRVAQGSVFARSNETLNLIGSGVDFIQARLTEDIFGSRPYFAVDPENPNGTDPQLADQVRKHLDWKLGPRQIGFAAVGERAIGKACKVGECVVKVSHLVKEEEYERIASILHDGKNPVVDAVGDYVFEEAGTEVGTTPEGVQYVFPTGHPDIALGVADPETGEPRMNEAYAWRDQIVTDRVTSYSGAKADPLHFKEFLCPLDVACIHDAPFVAHFTSMRLSSLRAQLGLFEKERGADGETKKGNINAYLKEVIAKLEHETSKEKKKTDPKTGEGEPTDIPDGDPSFRLVEAYFEFDARQTGRPQRIFCMVAYDYDLPIFWDYIRNVTPEGRYPFEVVRLIAEDDRWYGQSWFKKYASFQTLIDKFLNQIVYRNDLAANPIKFRRKEAVEQWMDGQPFEVGPDTVLDLTSEYTANDTLSFAEIPKLDQETKFLLETVIANWRTRSGVSTATQGSFGEMPSENTATGVQRITQSGNTMFIPLALRAKRGMEAVLQQVVDHQYAYQDANETFTYLEGDAELVGQLNASNISGLKFNVRLTLTNLRQSESLEKNQIAIGIFERFLTIPLPYKSVAAPLFGSVYKALSIDNPQDYFDQITEVEQQQMAAQAQAYGPENPAEVQPGDGDPGTAPDVEGSLPPGEAMPQ